MVLIPTKGLDSSNLTGQDLYFATETTGNRALGQYPDKIDRGYCSAPKNFVHVDASLLDFALAVSLCRWGLNWFVGREWAK